MDVLLTYDIATPDIEGARRLLRVAQVCSRYGTRVQYSVFECRLSLVSLARLMLELEHVIRPDLDSVHVYHFGGSITDARRSLGRPLERQLGRPWIV